MRSYARPRAMAPRARRALVAAPRHRGLSSVSTLLLLASLTPPAAAASHAGWWQAASLHPATPPRITLPAPAWSASPVAAGTPTPPASDVQPISPPAGLTLAEAIRRGLAINPSVRAAVADLESAGTEVDIARWGYYPELSLSAGPEDFPFREWGYDASARQMLYDWGRVESQVENADAAAREARRALGVAEEKAALEIAESYLDILAAQRRVTLTQRYIDSLTALDELTQARGQQGYTDRSERARVALDLAQARDDRITAAGELADARRQFRVLVGLAADDLTAPDPATLTRRLEASGTLDDWIAQAPAYRQAQAKAAQARATLDEDLAALKPQLNLEGSLQRRQIGGDLQNDSVIGLRLRMDTLQGLASFERPKASRQRLEAATYRIEESRREIRREVLTLIENAEVYRQRQQVLVEQAREADSVGTLYQDQFGVGLRDINDLLTIRQEAFNARRQLIDVESQQKRIEYRAAAQLGLIHPLIADALPLPPTASTAAAASDGDPRREKLP